MNFNTEIKGPSKPRRFFTVVCLAAAVLCFTDILIRGMDSPQIEIFFLKFKDFLADTFNVIGYSAYGDPYHCTAYTNLAEKPYPPLCYILLRPLANLVDIDAYYRNNYFLDMYKEPLLMMVLAILTFLQFILMFMLIRSNSKGSSLQKNLIALVFVLSRIVLYTVERGNMILLASIMVMIFIFYHNDKDPVKKETALIALAVAFALKLSPAVLGCLLLHNKQYKEAVRTAIYGLIFLLVPFLFLENGFDNIPQFISNIQLNNQYYYLNDGCTLRSCFEAVGMNTLAFIFEGFFRYFACAFLLIASFCFKRKWERAAALCMIMLFATDNSAYYGLIYLIPIAVLYFNEEKFYSKDWVPLLSFIMIFALYQVPFVFPDFHLPLLALAVYMLIVGTGAIIQKIIEIRASRSGKPELLKSGMYQAFCDERETPPSKKEKNVRLGILVAIFAVLAGSQALVTVKPEIKMEIERQKALIYFKKERYMGAATIFYILDDYRDCKEYFEICNQKLMERAEAEKAASEAADGASAE